MARLAACDPGQPQTLDAWLKGPVFYGSDVVLRGSRADDGVTFGLFPDGEVRPAILVVGATPELSNNEVLISP
jgi:hypothetical protein